MTSRVTTRKFAIRRPLQSLPSSVPESAGEPFRADRVVDFGTPFGFMLDVASNQDQNLNDKNRSEVLLERAEVEPHITISPDDTVNPLKLSNVEHFEDGLRSYQEPPEPMFSSARESTGWMEKLERCKDKNIKTSPTYYLRVPKTYIFEDDEDVPEKRSQFTLKNVSKHDITFMLEVISNECRLRYVNWIPKGEELAVSYSQHGNYADILGQKMFVFATPVLSKDHLEKDMLKVYWKAFGSELLPTSKVEMQTITPVARNSGASMLYDISCIPQNYLFEVMELINRRLAYELLYKDSSYIKNHSSYKFRESPQSSEPMNSFSTIWKYCKIVLLAAIVVYLQHTYFERPLKFVVNDDCEKLQEFSSDTEITVCCPSPSSRREPLWMPQCKIFWNWGWKKLLQCVFVCCSPPPPPEPQWYEYLFFWNWGWNDMFNFTLQQCSNMLTFS